MSEVFTLYHWEPNANSGKPILTLKEKGAPFVSRYIDMLKFEHHAPEYLAVNPLGVIPAATHGERRLYESTAIMEYVDAAFDGPPLRPSDPEERWRMRWWMKFMDEYFAPAVSMGAWSRNRGRPQMTAEEDAEMKKRIAAIPQKERRLSWTKATYGAFAPGELEESARKAAHGVRLMEENLKRHAWLAGESYSLADIDCFNTTYMLPTRPESGVSEAATPHLMEWLRRIYERPATKAAWDMGRSFSAERLAHLKRPEAA
jgi:GSH-dependent disulfide-bond oxidoreductase